MATRTYSIHECDVQKDGTEAVTSRTFAVQGREFEIDLCDTDAQKFDAAMEEWIRFARQTGGRRRPAPTYSGPIAGEAATAGAASGRASVKTSSKESDAAAIRAWAKGRRGMKVKPRGVIPQKVRDAYYADQANKGD